ncbi:MAG: OmpA family protein [Planctomycetota bacterium]
MRKKGKHPEHENLERWLVSYADFITLLFAFFTVLYAIAQKDSQKYKENAEVIRRSFLAATGLFRSGGIEPFVESQSKGGTTTWDPGAVPGDGSNKPQSAALKNTADDELSLMMRALTRKGIGRGKGDFSVVRSGRDTKIKLGERVLFPPGEVSVKGEQLTHLCSLGEQLKSLDFDVEIEGHSDAAPGTSATENWGLSLTRAANVARVLVEKTSFPKNRLSVVALGDTTPAATNETAVGRARNRRVEFNLIMK